MYLNRTFTYLPEMQTYLRREELHLCQFQIPGFEHASMKHVQLYTYIFIVPLGPKFVLSTSWMPLAPDILICRAWEALASSAFGFKVVIAAIFWYVYSANSETWVTYMLSYQCVVQNIPDGIHKTNILYYHKW